MSQIRYLPSSVSLYRLGQSLQLAKHDYINEDSNLLLYSLPQVHWPSGSMSVLKTGRAG